MGLTRSQQMARVKSTKTKPEMILRKALWQRGLRYRLKACTPAGRPDIIFPGAKLAVFVDGCFWHGCPQHYSCPKSKSLFWSQKLRDNVARDGRITRTLEEQGWQALRLWEHEVFQDLERVVALIETMLAEHRKPEPQWRVYKVIRHEEENLETRHLCLLRDQETTRTQTGPRITGKDKISKT